MLDNRRCCCQRELFQINGCARDRSKIASSIGHRGVDVRRRRDSDDGASCRGRRSCPADRSCPCARLDRGHQRVGAGRAPASGPHQPCQHRSPASRSAVSACSISWKRRQDARAAQRFCSGLGLSVDYAATARRSQHYTRLTPRSRRSTTSVRRACCSGHSSSEVVKSIAVSRSYTSLPSWRVTCGREARSKPKLHASKRSSTGCAVTYHARYSSLESLKPQEQASFRSARLWYADSLPSVSVTIPPHCGHFTKPYEPPMPVKSATSKSPRT